jgi:hypothetical protein
MLHLTVALLVLGSVIRLQFPQHHNNNLVDHDLLFESDDRIMTAFADAATHFQMNFQALYDLIDTVDHTHMLHLTVALLVLGSVIRLQFPQHHNNNLVDHYVMLVKIIATGVFTLVKRV